MKIKNLSAIVVLIILWCCIFSMAGLNSPSEFKEYAKRAGGLAAQVFQKDSELRSTISSVLKERFAPISAPSPSKDSSAYSSVSYAGGGEQKTNVRDFALKNLDGKTVKLSDFKDKVVFLDFWASWCPPCQKSTPAVKAIYEEFARNPNVVVIGINVGESKAKAQKYVADNKIKYRVLLDPKSEVAHGYGVRGIPLFVIIDINGDVAYSQSGYGPGLEKQWSAKIAAIAPKHFVEIG